MTIAAQREAAIVAEIEDALGEVDSLDEDRIVRRFVNAVQSAIRTNYYQIDKDGQPKQEISIKFSSRKLDGVPKPAPLYEIFVYSPRFEGRAHALRQGGARRHPLVRPAAGLPHRNPRPGEGAAGQERGDRAGRLQGRLCAEAACRSAARARRSRPRASRPTSCSCRALLDITDNLDLKGVVPPDNVVRHDDDDPYLVVAADKGTATFSDIANGDFGSSTASGWATPSPRAARPATTTRAWASPRAAPGNR